MMINKALLVLLLSSIFTAYPCQANNTISVVVDQVINVYDGDTFRVDIANYPSIIGENMPIRINGIDTPEIRGKCLAEKNLAQQAKAFTLQKLTNGRSIELRNIKRGKYFRLVADVYIDGKNLANSLLNAHLAKKYQGGKKTSWC